MMVVSVDRRLDQKSFRGVRHDGYLLEQGIYGLDRIGVFGEKKESRRGLLAFCYFFYIFFWIS